MHTGAGDLAGRPQPGKRGGAVEIGQHATAQVVRGGRHRQEVPGRIQTDRSQAGGDGREAGLEVLEVTAVEPHVVGALGQHRGEDGPRDDVTGQQLVDEPLAARTSELGAVTS